MQTTLSQLASRVDAGMPMRRRRRYRMQQLQNNNKPQTKFDAHLRHEGRSSKPPAMMPKTESEGAEPPSMPPSGNMRATWRRSFRHGLMHLRKANPQMPQSQMGWVMARLSRTLTDNPFMAENDIEALVETLANSAPEYETPED